jgi:hypothetical protein
MNLSTLRTWRKVRAWEAGKEIPTEQEMAQVIRILGIPVSEQPAFWAAWEAAAAEERDARLSAGL